MSASSRHSARFRSFGLFFLLALPSLSFGLLTSLTSKSAGPAHHPSQIQSELLPATIQSSESRPQVIPGPEGSFFRVDGRALVQVLPNGERSVWHEFSETEAVNAQLLEIGGTLFGTTQTGGTQNLGTLFGFNPQTGEMMTIWNFGEVDGARPAGNLIADRQGNIYGTTLNGGEDDTGVVFRLKLDGTGYKPVFHYLKSDGYDPTAGLILLADGSVTPVITPTKPENPPVDSRRGEFQPAATFTVATATDLVNAINSANTNGQADIINLTANIGLTSALPTLASDSGNSTTINGGGFTVFRAGGSFRIFTISNGAVVIMNNMTISGGSTGAFGGGILNQGNLTISNCRISGNSGGRGGGIRNENLLTMTDCTISGNASGQGGGAGFEFGTSIVSGCTFTGNIQTDGGAGSGGGVSHTQGGNVFLTNCTITGNTAASSSGAAGVSIILGSGSINLANCTISSNTTSGPGGGIRNFNGSFNLRNTIVFGNTGSTPDVDGFVSFAANNLVGSTAGSIGITGGVNGNIVGSDPVLGPLASNGGPTQTRAIGCASPARDAGTTVGTPTTDQRGVTRDTAPDIGAFEGPLVVTIGSPTPPSFDSPGSVSFPVTYVGAVSVNLTNAAITVNTTGSVVGTANVTNGTTATPTVTVTVTSGVGTVGISIAAGTATGNCGSGPTSASTAGPSPTATVTTSANGIAEAGNPQTVCASSPAVTLNGSFSGGATSATWSGGAGSFNPNTSALNAVYTPSAGEIAAGTVTLTLTTDDPPGSGVAGSDTVVITITPVATAEAGNAQMVCASSPAVTLAGVVGGSASSGTWSGGAGSFNPNASTLNAVYTPSAGEISAGTVTLTLTTNDPAGPCGPASDTVTITINPTATVDAGNPQTVCADNPAVTLAGVIGGTASNGTWSGGAGSFNPNTSALNAVYTPSAGEISAGTVTLTLTTNDPTGPCGAVSDTVTITISPVATAEAGNPQTVCASSPAVTLAGTVGGSASSGTWSGGAGSFAPNASTLNALYTPSAGEISAGTVTLTLTTNDPAGPCGTVSDSVVITIDPAATVDAGPNQGVCIGSPVQLAGIVGGAGSGGVWSGGAGSFSPNAGTLNAIYTPSPGEMTGGGVVLTLTTTDPAGLCGPVSDTVMIVINPEPTVDAGTPQTICSDSPVTLNGSIGGAATSATWSGGGSFSPNASALNAVYTPSAAEIAAGTATLSLTTNDPPGACTPVFDTVVITIEPRVTVDAGNNQTLCSDNPMVTLNGNIGGSATLATWSGGSGSFSPNASALNAVYMATPAEMQSGSITLTLTTNDPAGVCGPASDSVTIFFINCGSDTVLWVADTNNNRIQRFDGQNWAVVGVGTVGSGDGQFRLPEAVVASSDSQRVYVADTGNNRIQWSTDGGNTWANFATNGTGLNQVRSPKGLAYDALGNLYVSDNGNGRVLRFQAGLPGNSVVIASNGTASGQIMSPHGMVIDGTFRLFVTDEAQSRILRINNANTVTTSTTGSIISAKGVGLNHVMNPQGLALDPAGNLFVADTGNSRILRWANGNPATGTAWALTGSALGQVNRPEGVAIKFFQNGPLSGDLFLVVSDTSNNRIQGRFLSAGPWNLVGVPNNIGSGVGQFRSPSKIR